MILDGVEMKYRGCCRRATDVAVEQVRAPDEGHWDPHLGKARSYDTNRDGGSYSAFSALGTVASWHPMLYRLGSPISCLEVQSLGRVVQLILALARRRMRSRHRIEPPRSSRPRVDQDV